MRLAGYLIAQVHVDDPELYRKYQAAVLPTLQKHGGKVLAAASANLVFVQGF